MQSSQLRMRLHILWENWPKLKTGWIQFAWLFKISALVASNLGLLHCRQILDHLSYPGSPSFWKGVLNAVLFVLFGTLSHLH